MTIQEVIQDADGKEVVIVGIKSLEDLRQVVAIAGTAGFKPWPHITLEQIWVDRNNDCLSGSTGVVLYKRDKQVYITGTFRYRYVVNLTDLQNIIPYYEPY